MATIAGLGTIFRNSDIVRFVQGGVEKTFRYVPRHAAAPEKSIRSHRSVVRIVARGIGAPLSEAAVQRFPFRGRCDGAALLPDRTSNLARSARLYRFHP